VASRLWTCFNPTSSYKAAKHQPTGREGTRELRSYSKATLKGSAKNLAVLKAAVSFEWCQPKVAATKAEIR
jgi:hypothetical protein